jgi:hypothetical protein
MPKAKHRVRDKRDRRFPRGKQRLDPWNPLPPIGTILETTWQVTAYWGSIGPNTLVRVVAHTPEEPGNYGPGIRILPVDRHHSLYRRFGDPRRDRWGHPLEPPGDGSIYVCNSEFRTHTRVP